MDAWIKTTIVIALLDRLENLSQKANESERAGFGAGKWPERADSVREALEALLTAEYADYLFNRYYTKNRTVSA